MKVLSSALAAERMEWLQAWERSSHREPFAHPAFVSMFREPESEAFCAVGGDGSDVMFPFVLRPIREQWMCDALGSRDYFDARGAYGYAGAWTDDPAPASARRFWAQFD